MNNKLVKGYLLTIAGAVVLAAAAMIVLFNSGPQVNVRLFNVALENVSLGSVMVFSGLAGAFVLLMTKYMVIGIWSLWKGRREQDRIEKKARKLQDEEGGGKQRAAQTTSSQNGHGSSSGTSGNSSGE